MLAAHARTPASTRCCLAAVTIAACLSHGAAGQCYYTYTPIPKPPGVMSNPAWAINNRGEVVGTLGGFGDTTRVYIWSSEAGTRVLPLPPGIVSMESACINDFGVVAGAMFSNTTWYGYVWDGVNYTTIHLPPGINSLYVRGINNAGQVVGIFGASRGFVWDNGVATELSTIIGQNGCNAEAINQQSAIAGYANGTFGDAFLLDETTVTWLAEPASQGTQALAVSNNGAAVGSVLPVRIGRPGFRYLGAVWPQAPELIIVTPPTGVRDVLFRGVNDGGRVVGHYYNNSIGAIAWQNGGVYPLSEWTPGVSPALFRFVSDINRSGQITVSTDAGAVLTPTWLLGDVTGDCHVTLEDLCLLLANFGSPAGTYPLGDVDLDGNVDLRSVIYRRRQAAEPTAGTTRARVIARRTPTSTCPTSPSRSRTSACPASRRAKNRSSSAATASLNGCKPRPSKNSSPGAKPACQWTTWRGSVTANAMSSSSRDRRHSMRIRRASAVRSARPCPPPAIPDTAATTSAVDLCRSASW